MLSRSLIDLENNFFRFFIGPELLSTDGHELLMRLLAEEKVQVETKLPPKNMKNTIAVIFCNLGDLPLYDFITHKLIILPKEEEDPSLKFSFIDLNSLTEIDDLILGLKNLKIKKELEVKISQSEKRLEKYKKIKIEGPLNSSLGLDSLEYFSKCIELEVSLLKDKSFLSWNERLAEFANETKCFNKIMIGDRIEIVNLIENNKISLKTDEHYISLYDDKTILYIKTEESADQQVESFELLTNLLIRTLANTDSSLIKNDGEIDIWKKIFSKLPYPMAIISTFGDLLIHNESFAQLEILPKECLNYEDQKNFEIANQYFQLRRIPFKIESIEVFYFVFYSSSHNSYNEGTQLNIEEGIDELGIISSSIAHELNNPLAGILAALSLLALEDDWSEDSLNDINDMKIGAKRCKELVEIFLGFSRFSTNAENSLPIQNSLDQAINLLRFRMIESNFRIDIKYVSSFEKFNHQMNSSVLSMIFYLIFSELMTAFSHHKLVANNDGPVISGQVMEFSNQISIKLDNEFDFQNKIIQSKLITHLLKFEKIEMHSKSHEIKLICRL